MTAQTPGNGVLPAGNGETVVGASRSFSPKAVHWEYFTWAPTHTVWLWKVRRR